MKRPSRAVAHDLCRYLRRDLRRDLRLYLCVLTVVSAALLAGCHGERPDATPSSACDCAEGAAPADAHSSQAVSPSPPTSPPPAVVLVEAAKGEGPTPTFYPGLSGRPSIDAAHIDQLVASLQQATPPPTPKPASPKPTMQVVVPPKKPGQMPRGVPDKHEDRHDIRVKIEPYAEITPEGKAMLRWETWLDTTQGFVHFGIQIPDQLLDYPRYRFGATTETPGETTQHTAILTLGRLEKPIVDVAGYNAHGGGTVDYRIEVLNARSKLVQYVEGRFSYTKSDLGIYAPGVTITEGPFVDLPAIDGATISFETDLPTRAAVLVVDPSGKPQVFASSAAGTHHEVALTGLAPDTLYAYRVAAIDARQVIGWSGDFALRTAPKEARPFRFAVMSDSRAALGGPESNVAASNHTILRAFFTEAFKLGADFIIFPGDLVDGYTTQRRDLEMQFEAWKRAVEPVGHYIPIFEGMGNHEFLFSRPAKPRIDLLPPNSTEDVFAAEFVNPTNGPPPERPGLPPYAENAYSFDYGGVHFVSVNTNYWISSSPGADVGNREGFIMERQMAWLRQDLKAARDKGASFIFVFTHEPGFPNGGHRGDGMYWNGKVKSVNAMRIDFWSMMSEYAVDVVLHGDEHNYSRLLIDAAVEPSMKRPVWQVITGGCGAPFYAQDASVPWFDRVAKFSPQENFVMVDVLSATSAVLTTFGRNGELIDRFTIQR